MAFGVSLLVPATPAAAHNSLTGSDPRDGARVATAPTRIELRFLAKPSPTTTKITVTGPDNVVAGGPPAFSGTRVSVPFKPAAAGLYIVGYQVASDDGHPVRGEVRFTLTTGTAADPSAQPSPAGGAGPTASAAGPTGSAAGPAGPAGTVGGPAPGPSSGTSGSPAPAVPASADTLARNASGSSLGWLWGLGAILVLGALAAGLLLRRRGARR
ncbi:copper resistance protein CopC [Micromonospora sp. 067-2]|uniref:copper resistance protein CopC n=1 Tax=Micromonospora sp. 067-2 TaxID=2789270 RepID=UPI00397CA0E0